VISQLLSHFVLQAEDVMGSLLKEYLDTPQQRDDASNSSDNDEKQNEAADNDIICVDNELDPQKCLLKGDSMETDRTHGSDKSTEDEQNNGQVDDSSTAGEQFKNVVAIVDPPRSGLHPVVSKHHPHFLWYCVQCRILMCIHMVLD